MRTRRTNFPGPEPPAGEASSASLFTEVLHHVPHILDLVPPGDALSVACTCWPALLALLQYGRRTEEGECEWTQVTGGRSIYVDRRFVTHELELKHGERTFPVLQLGSIALLQGLALRVSAGSQYVGELQYAGARVPVQDAAALLGAVVAAGVGAASLLTHNVGELAAVLEAAGRPRAARLRVTSLAVQQKLLSSDRVTPDVREERVSALCRVLSSSVVREHARHIAMTKIGMGETAAAEVLGALSTGHALETLNVHGNTLGLTGTRALVKVVETSTKLRELDLDEVDLSNRGAITVSEAVLESGTIKQLVLDSTTHHDEFVEEFVRTRGGALDSLTIRNSDISNAALCKLLANAARLAHLDLDHWPWYAPPECSWAVKTTHALTSLVQSTTSLRTLSLSGIGIGPAQAKDLCEAITSNAALPLERLVLSYNEIDNDGARAVAAMLASNATLREIALGGSELTDAGYAHLAEALSGNTTLREISLCTAYMTANTFAKLARAVASSRLEVFEMRYATFPEDTTINIADLSKSSTLRRINIHLIDDPADMIMAGFEHRKGFQLLAGVHDFAAGLAHNNNVLRMLALEKFTGFAEPDAFGALADALRTNTALRSLTIKEACFEHSWAGAVDFRVLAQALRHNRGLRSVELGYGSDTGDDAKQMVVHALRENTTLQCLYLGGLPCELGRYGDGGRWSDTIQNVPGPFPRIVLQDTP